MNETDEDKSDEINSIATGEMIRVKTNKDKNDEINSIATGEMIRVKTNKDTKDEINSIATGEMILVETNEDKNDEINSIVIGEMILVETNKDTNDEINSNTTSEMIPVDFYLLWRSPEHENFTIQALFSSEAKFNFELLTRLSDGTRQDQNPCVYRLHLNLIPNANGEPTVKHKNTVYPARRYHLRISQKGRFYNSHFEENILRMIHNTDDSHHFLFDVVFRAAPGTFVLT
jgi:calcineurin-like phosphoesterase family protein